MDYARYEIEDFASDDFFIEWALEASPEARRFWEEYQKNNPSQRYAIEKATELLINLRKSEQTLQTPEKVRKMWQHIEEGLSGEPVVKSASGQFVSFWKIAACLSILACLAEAWVVLKQETSVRTGPENNLLVSATEGFFEEVNNTGDVIRIHLSDGSTVDLYDNSRLRYRKDHNGHSSRQVYLTGEAFFNIAKNPKQPFLVYSNEVVTKVLGTSFRVKALDADKDILVAVREGKVSVYSSRERKEGIDSIVSEVNGVVLTPNQQVVYARSEDSFVKTIIPDPQIIQHVDAPPLFVFENIPVVEVFDQLQDAYGVEIIADKEVMSNCFLTVRLGNEPLFEKLKIVCRTIGARYELIDAKIIITGKGC